ncbi:MAG TPA: TIGR04551 family protein [Kofleriaceae bacterium]|nr:TIGR04551 family protein [Kofleriaceae bacterium]
MPGPGQQPSGEEKKEGVAEAAPKTQAQLPTLPALPAAKGRRKRWKLIEIDGYFRMRTDWMKNFHEGFIDNPAVGGAPFPRALGCTSTVTGAPCEDALSSTNMRLRLEPTINLDEGTSIHIQADVLDNLVLGSTPINESYGYNYDSASTDPTLRPPLGAFGNNQGVPTAGVNSDRDSIQIKRAWGELAVPLGILKFGRMPNHWGMGIWANSGGYDPIAGTYDLDADYGDTVDRVSFSALIPGTNLRAMVASDWASTRLVSNQTSSGRGREGHPWDLDDNDDANGWTFVLSRMDSPQEFKDKIDRGDLAFNYGAYFEYKTQSFDDDITGFTQGGTFDSATRYLARDYKTYSPSLWAKLGIGRVTLEAELVGNLGKIGRLDEYGFTDQADIRKYGGAGRMIWRGLEGKLRLGVEGGFATGDQYDNTPAGNTNIAFANLIGDKSDTKLTQFIFNRDYKIDMILWRHLFGAVTNAAYAKPFLSYDLTKSIMFKVANITSFALKPVATPGNSKMYGTEFNADLGYSANGLFAGISYGVLFPFGAMSHPADDAGGSYGFSSDDVIGNNIRDAETSHIIQSRLVLQF